MPMAWKTKNRGKLTPTQFERECNAKSIETANDELQSAYFTERDRSFRAIVTDVGMLHERGLILRQAVTLW